MLYVKHLQPFRAEMCDTWKQPTCQVCLPAAFSCANLEPNESTSTPPSTVPAMPQALSRGKPCANKQESSLSFSLWIFLPHPKGNEELEETTRSFIVSNHWKGNNWDRSSSGNFLHHSSQKGRAGALHAQVPWKVPGLTDNEPTSSPFISSVTQFSTATPSQNQHFITHHRYCHNWYVTHNLMHSACAHMHTVLQRKINCQSAKK